MAKTIVLVTGATGFVGSHVVEALQGDDNIDLIAACRNPADLLPGFRGSVRQGDLRDAQYVRSLTEGVDVLCNAFAWTSAWNHKKASEALFYKPSIALIDAARAAGVKRFINTSTTSAAAPEGSADPMSRGIERAFWPHLANVVKIENHLRERATNDFQVVNLRLGLFAGARFGLGLLPMLLPRLRTHLVPWVNRGKTSMPIIDGRDVALAFKQSIAASGLTAYGGFNIVGPAIPTAREVLEYLHERWHYPTPHFSVPFFLAYPFAAIMEWLDSFVPWEPLVTRSIVHLLEEAGADNLRAREHLGFEPQYHWHTAIDRQMAEMQVHKRRFINMAKPVD